MCVCGGDIGEKEGAGAPRISPNPDENGIKRLPLRVIIVLRN